MRTYCLEADGEEVVGWGDATHAVGLQVTERLDRSDAPTAQIFDQALEEHPAEAASAELRDDVGVHQSTASALTGLVGKATDRGTYCGGA